MDTYTLTIDSLDNEGRGISTLPNGKKIFIPGVLPGEECLIELTKESSRYAEGVCTRLLTQSQHRIQPHGVIIPGCNLAHLSYDQQVKYKQNKVINCLTRIGHLPQEITSLVNDTVPSAITSNYRNHMQYKIAHGKVSLTAEGSNTPVPAELCPLEYSVFSDIRKTIDDIFDVAPTTLFSGLVLRGSERTQEVLMELVSDSEDTHERIINATNNYLAASSMVQKIKDAISDYNLRGITLRMSRSAVEKRTRGGKRVLITGEDFYTETLCGRTFKIKAGAFFQVNIPQAEVLYKLASESIANAKTVCDIYCGTGSIGLSVLHEGQQLLGVESVSEAVASAKENAALSGVANAKFICKPAEKFNFQEEKLPTPIAAIVDPPRQGLDFAFVNHLLKLSPDSISYVSCDPATMARDLAQIVGSGKYEIRSVTPVDMFPQTSHVETVVQLSKGSVPSQDVKVKFSMENVSSAKYVDKPATYEQIKTYVKEHSGLNVSSLYIAQVKQKYGIIERDCYNLPKSDDSRQPKCPESKEKAIVEALKYFKMI
ncbi:MAG: 23S rRNA (uracil(1939)-C(5))-methyltransferase RlmD [Saccharofermentans sp.]|nr:23S rRNA (uracil(1939)-C(5))-methyltransferase RlmD [Saccharofermentans sp.]